MTSFLSERMEFIKPCHIDDALGIFEYDNEFMESRFLLGLLSNFKQHLSASFPDKVPVQMSP